MFKGFTQIIRLNGSMREITSVRRVDSLPWRQRLNSQFGWRVDGLYPGWGEIAHGKRGKFVHLEIRDERGRTKDVVDCGMTPGALVLPIRYNPDNQPEVFLFEEERVVKDKRGNYRTRWILSPVAGEIEEADPDAATRARTELTEETGYSSMDLISLGTVGLSVRTSSSRHHLFAALIPFDQQPQALKDGEPVRNGRWYPLEIFHGRTFEDGRLETVFNRAQLCFNRPQSA